MKAPKIPIVLFFLLVVCSAMAADALRVAVAKTPLSLPFYVAESQNYFAAEGVAVRLADVIGGHRTLQQVLAGEADLATSSEAVVMFNSFKRNDFAVLASFVSSDDDVKIIARKDLDLTRTEQIAGMRFATVVGAASHYYLDTWLLFHGVDTKSVKVVNMQPEAMSAALSKGEVDAVAIWEPHPFMIVNAVPGAKLLPNTRTYVLTFNLVGQKTMIRQREDELVRLLRALDRAQSFIKAEPKKAQAILRTRLGLDQAFIDWIWPHYTFRLALDQWLMSAMESQARWARREGYVADSRSINYLDFIESGPLRKVRPELVGIVK